jgi:hypothetical protein
LQSLFDHEAETLSHVISLACLGWWANTKLLLLALGRGSLRPDMPMLQYSAALLLPVLPANGDSSATPRAAALAARFAAKTVVLAAVAGMLAAPPFPLPVLLRDVLFTLGLYTLIGAIMDGPGALAAAALRLPLLPHFNAPLVACGVGEFWGKRWNLTAATLLRQSVYEPIAEGQACGDDGASAATPALPPPSLLRRALAVCATFAVRTPRHVIGVSCLTTVLVQVSGVAHELIFWSATREPPRLQWLAFFALQGPVVIAEALLRSALRRRGVVVPTLLAIPLTWAAVLLPATALFFPPPVRTGLDKRVVASLRESFNAAAAALGH